MKKTISLIIVALVFAGWTLYNLITGIAGLSKSGMSQLTRSPETGTRCEVTVDIAMEVYEIEHRLNGLIPTGSEHFYFAASEDEFVPLLIKASPSWFEKNFDEEGLAKNTVTVMCEVSDFDSGSTRKLNELNRTLSAFGGEISTAKYLNADYRMMYLFRLAAGAASIGAVAAVIVLLKLGVKSGVAAKAATIFLIAAVLFCLADLLVLEHL